MIAAAIAWSALAGAAVSSPSPRQDEGHAAEGELTLEDYEKTSEMVPMRDGTKLYTEMYTPRTWRADDKLGAAGPASLPILFLRTPYGVSAGEDAPSRYLQSTFRELLKTPYVIAVQDARGRHGSEGELVWNRPLRDRRDPEAIDASTDAYDSIEWLTKNVPGNSGRVGMLGVSYPGWYVTMALVDAHPALACASPQASPSDYFVNDDFFHNGAFRLSPSAELPFLLEFDRTRNARFPYDQVDTYEFFLDLPSLAELDRSYFEGRSPTWKAFMEHRTYDGFWREGNTLQHLDHVPVPVLNVVGWWDAENLGGALDIYAQLEPHDTEGRNRLIVGPWSHGQWAAAEQTRLGMYSFGADTSGTYQRDVEAPWFAHHLRGGPDPGLPEALMFQTGSNVWKRYDAWPPATGVEERSLHLHSNGELRADLPRESGFVEFVSDPAKPVPYSERPIMGFWQGLQSGVEHPDRFDRAGKLWKVEDQRFVADRPDVLVFQTEPLEEAIELSGALRAELFVSTTGTDADWIVKVIDVYPEDYGDEPWMGGYQLMVADDVVRGRFRTSLEDPKPMQPGVPTKVAIDLRTRNHLFRRGHRVMVQVQSTWFPLIGRNPQAFIDIPAAERDDFVVAEHRVWAGPAYPSRIVFDGVSSTGAESDD